MHRRRSRARGQALDRLARQAFGVHAYPSGSKYYVVQTRANGKAAKRVTAEEGRRRAALIIARIKAGEAPLAAPAAALAEGPTVGELASRWLEEHVAVRCKPRTVEMYTLIVRKHLLLTGLRRNEVLALRRRDVDLDAREIKLEDSKTGARVAPLSPEAARVLAGIPRVEGNPHVIPGKKAGTHLRNLNDPWDRIRKRAKLEDVRLHDCRHSFASRALALGEGLTMIGKLLGHTKVETTRGTRIWRGSRCASPPSPYPTASPPTSSRDTRPAARTRPRPRRRPDPWTVRAGADLPSPILYVWECLQHGDVNLKGGRAFSLARFRLMLHWETLALAVTSAEVKHPRNQPDRLPEASDAPTRPVS